MFADIVVRRKLFLIRRAQRINGIGKEYIEDGDLKFVDEYLNGKRNGKEKEFI